MGALPRGCNSTATIYLELWAEDDYNEKTDTAIEALTQQGEEFFLYFPVWLRNQLLFAGLEPVLS